MVPPTQLDKDLCLNVLTYLMFLKRKQTGKIKAWGCADGRPQREYIGKDKSSSRTVSTYALFAMCAINAIEKQTVVTCDIPGAFLQSEWPKDKPTYLKFDGIMVDMLIEINPKLKQYMINRKGYKLMYGQLEKAVYSTLLGAILFYKKLATKLDEWGFTMNPYDACTWNKMINGKQLTVQAHVDDLQVSSEDSEAIDELIKDLYDVFKTKFNSLTVTKGKVHNYLGINIDYGNENYVKLTMYDYIEDILKEARKDMNRTCPTPALGTLFNVNKQSPKLNAEDAEYFP